MQIIFYISRFGIGGVQTFVIQLAKELSRRENIDVAIFCHYPDFVDTTQNEAIPGNIQIWTLTRRPFLLKIINKATTILKAIFPSFDLKEYFITRYFLSKLNHSGQTILHLNTEVGDSLQNCYQAYTKLDIPYIFTLHGTYKHLLKTNLSSKEQKHYSFIFKRLLATTEAIVYLSNKNLLPFEKVLGDRTFFKSSHFFKINNGIEIVDLPQKIKQTTENMIFGMIARGDVEKGWLELLEVFDELVREGHQQIELRLFASGTYVDQLMASKNWVPAIRYYGATNTPMEEIIQFDIGLLPSYAEEMPFTIIEYLAAGKPCIATNVGAIADMLRAENNQIAGILLPLDKHRKVSKKHLKEAILTFITNDLQRENCEKLAKEAFKKFDIKNTCNEYFNLYNNALSKISERKS